MKKTLWAAVVASFLLVGLTACDLLFGGNNGKSGNSGTSNNTDVDNAIKGNITTKITWDGKDAENNPITYFINSSIYIKDGGNLTITDGAIVKFGPMELFM